MPKKFSGVNTKAEVARERKASAKQAVADKKRLDEEDAYWRDDDRHGARKDQRKVMSEAVDVGWYLSRFRGTQFFERAPK